MKTKKIITSSMLALTLLGASVVSTSPLLVVTAKADSSSIVYTNRKLVSTTKKTAEGYAGGVRTKFPTGGGFYVSSTGGPSVSIGVSGYGFGVSLGYASRGGGGRYVSAPDRVNYYRVYVKKHYVIKKYAQYGHTIQSNKQIFVKYVYSSSLVGEEYFAKKA